MLRAHGSSAVERFRSSQTLEDERSGKRHDFCYDGGIVSFVQHLNRTRSPLHEPPILISGKRSYLA